MRKWVIGVCMISVLFGPSAYAHVSGVFGDFLVGIKDESTTEKLKNEINETKEEIERLTPKIQELEKQYSKKEDVAVSKLQFYNTIGVDTLLGFILNSHDITDVLANQRMVEKNLEDYLQELNSLYLDYMQVKVTKESLEGHERLLKIIQDNVEKREALLEKHPVSSLSFISEETRNDRLVDEIAIIWENEVVDLSEILESDSNKLNQNLESLFTRKTSDSPFRMQENAFNELADLEYHFRSDHVYVHMNKGKADVILIGVVSKNDAKTAGLHFEAGFINGIMIPPMLLIQFRGFNIDYAKLNPNSKDFYVEQANGVIVIQSAEKAGE